MNTLPLIFVIWCIMNSEVSGMEKNALHEKWYIEARKIRIQGWLFLSVIFTILFLITLFRHQYMHFNLPLYYVIPFSLPALMSWFMFIGVTKRDTVGKDGYNVAKVFVIIMIIASLFLMIITEFIVRGHENSTSNIHDYERARFVVNTKLSNNSLFPDSITDNMQNITFKYYAEDSSAYMSLTFYMSDEDFEKERAAIESKSILIDDELHNKISHTIQSDFDISELAPTISCDHFYSDVQIYYLDHDFKQTYTTVRTGENNKLTPIPSGYKGENFYCAMLCDKENIIVYYYHHLIVSV